MTRSPSKLNTHSMRKVVLKLHRWIALIGGFFIVVLSLTGSIMAFEQEIDHLVHWKVTYVTEGSRMLSLADITAIVTRAFPGEAIRGYNISTSREISYQVATRKRTVFVNQYNGEILGNMAEPDRLTKFLGDIHQLHLRLLIRSPRDPGKTIESWAGVAIIFLSLSGLYLWWPLKRVTIEWNGPTLRRWFDLHNTAGFFSLVFLLILASTGTLIGFDETTTPLFFKITGSSPPPRFPRTSGPHTPETKPITPDQAVEIARTALAGAAPFAIEVPGPNGVYFIRARFPEDLTPGGRSQIVIDQYSGKVLFVQGSRTAPAGARLV